MPSPIPLYPNNSKSCPGWRSNSGSRCSGGKTEPSPWPRTSLTTDSKDRACLHMEAKVSFPVPRPPRTPGAGWQSRPIVCPTHMLGIPEEPTCSAPRSKQPLLGNIHPAQSLPFLHRRVIQHQSQLWVSETRLGVGSHPPVGSETRVDNLPIRSRQFVFPALRLATTPSRLICSSPARAVSLMSF